MQRREPAVRTNGATGLGTTDGDGVNEVAATWQRSRMVNTQQRRPTAAVGSGDRQRPDSGTAASGGSGSDAGRTATSAVMAQQQWRDSDDGGSAATTAASRRRRRRGSGNSAVNDAMVLSDRSKAQLRRA
ncbi:hypothetical protein Syun_021692 [Stephania yunnanensis]|uniref:Uncharacterized protein n=1 Tax=Stephania yunnanensis TaxID=152371 RepID=A0AAP0NRB4_9MAGN